MATLDWPNGAGFAPSAITWGASTTRNAWASPYTGQVTSISLLADRLTCTLVLPAIPPRLRSQVGAREAFLMELASAGHWVRLGYFHRPVPVGSLRGAPFVTADAAAGARSLVVQTTPGAVLLAGDVLGAPAQLLSCGHGGAVANGSGLMTMPLVLPLRKPLTSGTGLVWDRPVGTFQLAGEPRFDYRAPCYQGGVELTFVEVYA